MFKVNNDTWTTSLTSLTHRYLSVVNFEQVSFCWDVVYRLLISLLPESARLINHVCVFLSYEPLKFFAVSGNVTQVLKSQNVIMFLTLFSQLVIFNIVLIGVLVTPMKKGFSFLCCWIYAVIYRWMSHLTPVYKRWRIFVLSYLRLL